jgi:predicted TIM-barrel fold metal-dependent hydrolase
MEHKVISADTHLFEPPDLWTTRLPRDMRDRAARLEWTDENMHFIGAGGQEILTLTEYRDSEAAMRQHSTLAHWESDIEADGLWGSVIHPNVGLLSYCADNALAFAHARVYNDYVVELFGESFGRYKPTAIVPLTNTNDAVIEVERVARLGLRGIIVPVEAPIRYCSDAYDRVWSAAQANGLVVVFHIGVRTADPSDQTIDMHELKSRIAGGTGPKALSDRLRFESQQSVVAQSLIADLVGGGVLERFPELHFMITEFNAYWLAGLMGGFDKAYTLAIGQDVSAPDASQGIFDHGLAAGAEQPLMVKRFGMNEAWPYPLRPSDYIRRQIHCTFQDDPMAVALRDVTGVECLLWGSDYPHHEGSWPRSREALDTLFHGLPDEDRRAITGGTIAKLFGFDPSA